MRRCLYLVLSFGLSVLLSACVLPGSDVTRPDGVSPNAITGGEIAVTALDPVPAAVGADGEGTEVLPGPGDGTKAQSAAPEVPADAAVETPSEPAPQPDLTDAVPVVEKSEQQLACEKKKGSWSSAGGKSRICLFNTRDAGKRCTRESQCEGACLARSGTCSPIRPLLGCNEILQDDGARVTLCIN